MQEAPGIFTVNADGSGEKLVSEADVFSIMPAWSPDGNRIVYSRGRGQEAGLRIVTPEGVLEKDIPVSNDGGSSGGPMCMFSFWLPDGKKFGYTRLEPAQMRGLVTLMAVDGSSSETISGTGFNLVGNGGWSPDGKTLAIARVDFATGQGSLWLIDLATRGETNLITVMEERFNEPILPTAVWSPDSKWLAVAVMDKQKKSRIVLVTPDGKTKKPITPEGEVCFGPTWTK